MAGEIAEVRKAERRETTASPTRGSDESSRPNLPKVNAARRAPVPSGYCTLQLVGGKKECIVPEPGAA